MIDELEEYRIYRNIICIDLKSFYASVECADRGLDPFETPLVVADKSRGGGSIILAVSPFLRKKGVPSRLRIFELPKDEKIIFAKPRMKRYLEASAQVINIYLRYLSKEDIHIYSIDECFLDFTNYQKIYNCSTKELAKRIISDVYNEMKLTTTAGIGPNMLLAKLSMDIEAKKVPDGIAEWTYADVPKKLYPVKPLSKMWGIGKRYEISLNKMGFKTIGDIARSDVNKMKEKFGIIGEELWYHTHGIDMSLIQDKKKFKPLSKSYGIGQVLFNDYHRDTIETIILEMSDEISTRLRATGKKASTVHLFVGFNQDYGGGIAAQVKLDEPIVLGTDIKETCMKILYAKYKDEPIRRIQISVTGLIDSTATQLNLFEDNEKKIKEERLYNTIDEVKRKYGKNSVRRASSEFDYSTAKERNKQVGGHRG